jgi:predicted dehydrogenase
MRFLSRRDFLHDSAALAAALASASLLDNPLLAAPEPKNNRKGDANDTLHVAIIGVHGRGREHVSAFAGKHNCVITTICDADEAVIGSSMRHVEKVQGKPPRFEQDLRRVMEDPSIDIISTATPNHWHALVAIWAMQHGKDVYVEKPVSHNVSEGRRIVEAAQKYNRICQTGTQSRSSAGMRGAMDFLHAGKLGKIKLARGLCYKLRPSIGKVKGPQPIPKTVDYDLWCGPAPNTPLMRRNLHYDWHWMWDYGNGDLGNQGIHEMDKARWGLGKNELPKSVLSVGGRFGYEDDGQTANTQICVFDYGDCELIFEVRGLPSRDPFPGKDYNRVPMKPQNFVGNVFYGSEGILVCPSYTAAVALTHAGEVIKKFSGDGDHFGNFVKAVRSRNASDLNAPIVEGHLSSALCHLGNVSFRLGTLQPFSQKTHAFGDDKEAYETLARMEDHLKESKVPMEETSYRVGRRLVVDPATERFVQDTEADQYLTREYRKPFVVPAKV